jgi:hypothetical protein
MNLRVLVTQEADGVVLKEQDMNAEAMPGSPDRGVLSKAQEESLPSPSSVLDFSAEMRTPSAEVRTPLRPSLPSANNLLNKKEETKGLKFLNKMRLAMKEQLKQQEMKAALDRRMSPVLTRYAESIQDEPIYSEAQMSEVRKQYEQAAKEHVQGALRAQERLMQRKQQRKQQQNDVVTIGQKLEAKMEAIELKLEEHQGLLPESIAQHLERQTTDRPCRGSPDGAQLITIQCEDGPLGLTFANGWNGVCFQRFAATPQGLEASTRSCRRLRPKMTLMYINEDKVEGAPQAAVMKKLETRPIKVSFAMRPPRQLVPLQDCTACFHLFDATHRCYVKLSPQGWLVKAENIHHADVWEQRLNPTQFGDPKNDVSYYLKVLKPLPLKALLQQTCAAACWTGYDVYYRSGSDGCVGVTPAWTATAHYSCWLKWFTPTAERSKIALGWRNKEFGPKQDLGVGGALQLGMPVQCCAGFYYASSKQGEAIEWEKHMR